MSMPTVKSSKVPCADITPCTPSAQVKPGGLTDADPDDVVAVVVSGAAVDPDDVVE